MIRMALGLTLAKLATRSGMDGPTISRIENGHVAPSAPSRKRLAKALGMEESVLFPEAEAAARKAS